MDVQAYLQGDGSPMSGPGIVADSLNLLAEDTSKITAITVGASLAASVVGETGVAVAVGVSLSKNEISNQIEASIQNADNVVSTGDIVLAATDHAIIHSVSVAASLAAGFSKTAGFSLSGAGAESTNKIDTKTNALVENSVLIASGDVTITSNASSAAGSETLTPVGTVAAFTAGLDDAATTDLLEADKTIGGTVYKEGTPDPTDFNADNVFKTNASNRLASAGIKLSTDPNVLAVTIRNVDTGANPTDPDDDTGVEWSVTDRKSGISVILSKDARQFHGVRASDLRRRHRRVLGSRRRQRRRGGAGDRGFRGQEPDWVQPG